MALMFVDFVFLVLLSVMVILGLPDATLCTRAATGSMAAPLSALAAFQRGLLRPGRQGTDLQAMNLYCNLE